MHSLGFNLFVLRYKITVGFSNVRTFGEIGSLMHNGQCMTLNKNQINYFSQHNAKLSCKTTCVCHTDDKMQPIEDILRLLSCFKHCILHAMHKIGHLLSILVFGEGVE